MVVCTAYSDYSWEELLFRLHAHDRLLILKKPFDNIEVQQMANTLAAKWDMARHASLQTSHLEHLVEQRTLALTQASQALQLEIDERKQLESQLVQSEKLASLGQLAAGVAHEINNPVGFISSNLGTLGGYFNQLQEMLDAYRQAETALGSDQFEALRRRLDLDFLKEDIPTLLRESKEGIGRVVQIVKDLKDFSRVDNDQTWQWANLQQGIDSTLNIVASELKYKADVIKHYTPLPDIECLASQLNQVVMNLVINAAQAMGPERGTITISTGVESENIWLEVADNGCGIAPDSVQKIFDPFFTTKPVGEGTGLGLSLSYGIVKKHRGTISVSSEVGKGTTFRVVLPIRQTV
ncbi:ATP-binding protein [Pseudomonas sp. S191]|uniref:ATP-binding protein n=1 Tax=Pseudomonas sp. S191 TaxID=579575 RepID=UPI00387B2302